MVSFFQRCSAFLFVALFAGSLAGCAHGNLAVPSVSTSPTLQQTTVVHKPPFNLYSANDTGYRILLRQSQYNVVFAPPPLKVEESGKKIVIHGPNFFSAAPLARVADVRYRRTVHDAWASLNPASLPHYHVPPRRAAVEQPCIDENCMCDVSTSDCTPGGNCNASVQDCGPCPDCNGPIASAGGMIDCYSGGSCSDSPVGGAGIGSYKFPTITCDFDFGSSDFNCNFGETNMGSFSDPNLLISYYFFQLAKPPYDDITCYTPTYNGWKPPFRGVVTYNPNNSQILPDAWIDNDITTDEVSYEGLPGTITGTMQVIFSTQYGAPYATVMAGHCFGNNPVVYN